MCDIAPGRAGKGRDGVEAEAVPDTKEPSRGDWVFAERCGSWCRGGDAKCRLERDCEDATDMLGVAAGGGGLLGDKGGAVDPLAAAPGGGGVVAGETSSDRSL